MLRLPRTFALLALGSSLLSAAPASPLGWPEGQSTHKPWTRWWWPGSAVDPENLTRQLEAFAQAGLGGVEITPIYGAKGAEPRYRDYLSASWLEQLAHTGREGKRLGLGVDMATGTGWPFGGPWIGEEHASKKAVLREGVLTGAPTQMKVKRAAPGGEGLVIDPFSTAAIARYLEPFSRAFAVVPAGLVRAQFHDSFEYYGASWTPDLERTFREMHGYDLAPFAAELLDAKPTEPERLGRLKSDYRHTLARLHLDYLNGWVNWSHDRGFLVRNQSHGAPANLLDLYGSVDIPETETFGSTPFPIPGLRRDPRDVRSDQDLPEALMIRMASSAAHVMGRPLASSETCTWLREHWKESLAFTKPEIDRLFACGINHLLYHGTVYSPADAEWPGWLFYASTQFNPANPWWDDFAALNAYVTRVQSVLQSGQPDNDILLYWPFADVLDEPKGLMKQFGVHNVGWLLDSPMGLIAADLSRRGFSFDYISDAQLRQTRAEGGSLATPGGRYRVVIVPAVRRMPLETLEHLLALSKSATVLFTALPEDVPGLARLDERRARLRSLNDEVTRAGLVTRDLLAALAENELSQEPIASTGIDFIRRASSVGHDYFFTNLTGQSFSGWMKLGRPARAAALLNPLNAEIRDAALRQSTSGVAEVFLELAAGESMILRTATQADSPPRAMETYLRPTASAVPLTGEWSVEFIKGGPELPASTTTRALNSWTEFGGEAVQRFAGTARYRLEFAAPPARADDWLLDLGDVRDSARVRLNGVEIATVWSLPFRVRLGPGTVKPGSNVLEIDVTNLAANRIRDLDRRGVDWKIMHEINFVNINYKPFDASGWELTPSGLLGPVTLTPLERVDPAKASK